LAPAPFKKRTNKRTFNIGSNYGSMPEAAPFRHLKINSALTRNDSALYAIPYSGRECRLKLEMIQTLCGKTRYLSLKIQFSGEKRCRKAVEKL
jgi:hypothetical protein